MFQKSFENFYGQPNQPGPLFTTPKVIIPLRVTCSVISKFERNQKKPGFTSGLFVPFKTHQLVLPCWLKAKLRVVPVLMKSSSKVSSI